MSWRALCVLAVVLALASVVGLAQPRKAEASHFCGKFHEPGLLTTVQVYANRFVSCDRAVAVMKRRFNGDTAPGWHCIGPQTGYALCTKDRKRVSAHF